LRFRPASSHQAIPIVNFTARANGTFASSVETRQRRKRVVLGFAISLALHALLIAAWRTSLMRPRTEAAPVPRSIAVWLRPPPPAPTAAEPQQPDATPHAGRESTAAPRRSRRVIAVPATPQAAPAPFVVQPAPQAEPDPAAPRFDRDAARQMARQLASVPDPARAGTAVGQLPEKPLQTESKAARAIGAARRGDCKDGLPGGLLGPIIILLDKKDSGCQW
jgi:hypothetical protein